MYISQGHTVIREALRKIVIRKNVDKRHGDIKLVNDHMDPLTAKRIIDAIQSNCDLRRIKTTITYVL